MSQSVKVDGIAYYASILRPNKATGAYGLDLVVDEDTSKQLQALGLMPAKKQDGTLVSHGESGGDVFRFKRKTHKADGTPLEQTPQLVDSKGNAMKELVGNGSKVRIYGNVFEYNFKGKKGVSGGLNAMQVIDLVQYSTFDTIEGGFTAVDSTDSITSVDVDDEDVI